MTLVKTIEMPNGDIFVPIPKRIIKKLNLREGDEMNVEILDGAVCLTKTKGGDESI